MSEMRKQIVAILDSGGCLDAPATGKYYLLRTHEGHLAFRVRESTLKGMQQDGILGTDFAVLRAVPTLGALRAQAETELAANRVECDRLREALIEVLADARDRDEDLGYGPWPQVLAALDEANVNG